MSFAQEHITIVTEVVSGLVVKIADKQSQKSSYEAGIVAQNANITQYNTIITQLDQEISDLQDKKAAAEALLLLLQS